MTNNNELQPTLPSSGSKADSGKYWLGAACAASAILVCLGGALCLALVGVFLAWKIPAPTAPLRSTATPSSLSPEIVDHGAKMVLIPAGTFTMGGDINDDEKPVHQITLPAFYMDVYEVTNALYRNCVDKGNCQKSGWFTRTYYNYSTEARFNNYPVVGTDWYMAQAYCRWRGARLPTEAEWEKAARGTDERTYPWGEGIDRTRANYDKDDTQPVGSYESGKSPYGLYDMAGNVWEWVSSLYKPYPYNALDGREDPHSNEMRVLRGGAWISEVKSVRSTYRYGVDPTYTGYYLVGFRCARSIP